MRDKDTSWVEADITVNGHPLTFAESMALRVAVTSYRMFVRGNAADLGRDLANGYDYHLNNVEAKIFEAIDYAKKQK